MLRAVRLNVLSRPTRVAPLHTPARRVSLATSGRVSNASAGVVYASAVQSGKLTNSYATTAGRSKGKTSKTTRATKTTKASKGRKTAKTGGSRASAKPKKAPKRRVLTEKQKAARDAKKKREEIKQLLETALTPPKKLSPNAHSVGFKEKFEEARKMGGDMKQVFQRTAEMVKSMDPEDREVRLRGSLTYPRRLTTYLAVAGYCRVEPDRQCGSVRDMGQVAYSSPNQEGQSCKAAVNAPQRQEVHAIA